MYIHIYTSSASDAILEICKQHCFKPRAILCGWQGHSLALRAASRLNQLGPKNKDGCVGRVQIGFPLFMETTMRIGIHISSHSAAN